MPEIIISDTSCLIVLSKINEIEILKKLYSKVIVSEDVANEFIVPLPDWVVIKSPIDKTKQQILEIHIDKGEASSITLALEQKNCTLILDDIKARKVAETLGLKITGTLGILIKAKHKKLIPLLKPILDKIKSSGFHLSKNLETAALKEAGE